MYVRVQEKTSKKTGEPIYYAAVVRSDRIKGKVVQTLVINLGVVTEEQIPYLKAAYSKDKPKLLYADGSVYPNEAAQ